MSEYLGDYPYGATVYVPCDSYDANGASVTLSGLAVTDIEIYKNGNTTQRASDNGYTLLDTDGIDFDTITGINGFSIDTSDNSTAGFFGPGNDYWVVVASVTIDAQTVNFTKTFSIENRHHGDVLIRTTIATLASQTSFTLTAGSADNSAYNGCLALVQDAVSVVQKAIGVISAYTGSTKTITLLNDPAIFTMAAGDYITILVDRSLKPTVDTRTLDVSSAGEAGLDWANVGSPTTSVSLTNTTVATVTTASALTTNNDKTGYRLDATGSAALTEGYAADGATATLPQLLYLILALLSEFSVSSTTLTAKKLDGSTTAATFTLDDGTNPTSITRAS